MFVATHKTYHFNGVWGEYALVHCSILVGTAANHSSGQLRRWLRVSHLFHCVERLAHGE